MCCFLKEMNDFLNVIKMIFLGWRMFNNFLVIMIMKWKLKFFFYLILNRFEKVCLSLNNCGDNYFFKINKFLSFILKFINFIDKKLNVYWNNEFRI